MPKAAQMAQPELYVACIAGFVSHCFIFKIGEWHLRATNLLKLYLVSYITITWLEVEIHQMSWLQGMSSSSWICCMYVTCIWASMIMYRVHFHPLCGFPGPRAASVSKLWHVAQCHDSKNHLLMERLHARYGSFVRIGKHPYFQ